MIVRDDLILRSAQAVTELERLTGLVADPKLIIGGSCQQGYPELKTRLTGVLPGAFTHFIPGARFTAGEEAEMAAYVADGVMPSLSFHVGTEADTDYNIGRLVANGWDDLVGAWCIGNEPTQKPDPPAVWRAANQYAASVLPASWQLVLGPFQRVDVMAAENDPRFIGNWVGPDPQLWCRNLGINVYDKNQSTGQSFEQLVQATGPGPWSVEGWALDHDMSLWVREAGAPETQTGAWTRPVNWKPAWYRGTLSYTLSKRDLYRMVNVFNSAIGGGPPPEGWFAWSSPQALAAYREITLAANLLT